MRWGDYIEIPNTVEGVKEGMALLMDQLERTYVEATGIQQQLSGRETITMAWVVSDGEYPLPLQKGAEHGSSE